MAAEVTQIVIGQPHPIIPELIPSPNIFWVHDLIDGAGDGTFIEVEDDDVVNIYNLHVVQAAGKSALVQVKGQTTVLNPGEETSRELTDAENNTVLLQIKNLGAPIKPDVSW